MAGDTNYLRLRANLTELEPAWQDRIEDANALIAANRPASAIAMSIYALEIFLKTLICRRLDLDQLPIAFEIHQLDGLLLLTGLSKRLDLEQKIQVKDHWDLLLKTSRQVNDLRYKPDGQWNMTQAIAVIDSLTNPHNGILSWLNRQP